MRSILLTLLVVTIFSVSGSAQGFNGAYALTNWTQTLSADDEPVSTNTGSFDITNPNEVIIFGSDDPEGDPSNNIVTSDFSIIASTSGIWSFQWEYHTDDASTQPELDEPLVLINDGVTSAEAIVVPSPLGPIDQTGTYTSALAITAGDKITIRMRSTDNTFGAARVRIFNFVEPGGTLLPVRMNYFNAKQSGEQVKLEWSTETETNSDKFDVERSTNGKDFKVIATVRAAGNSSLTQNYSAIDNNPENGNNYYRLRQVDLDGKFTYSMIKTLKWTTLQLVKLYPNPVRNMVTVRFTPERNETTSITLFDGSGRTLQRRNIAAVAGSNMVTEWNVEALAPGMYFFRINSLTSPLRFVKQ